MCRRDIDEATIVDISVAEKEIEIQEGWQIVYVQEEAIDEISAHDTAAMSLRTRLVVKVVPIHKFVYSADIFVIGVVSETGNVNQYV